MGEMKMADVTGPISTLPGTGHKVPPGTMCDYHPDVPAVRRVQGETDSFGCELNDYCQTCIDAQRTYAQSDEGKAAMAAHRCGHCDWCKQYATDLGSKRDWEEGSAGPVYRVCGACVDKETKRLAEELRDRDPGPDYDEPMDDD